MSRPEPGLPSIMASLAAHVAAARRSGLRLAGGRPAPASLPAANGPETLQQIRRDLGDCSRCPLCSRRTSIVFGQGGPRPRLAFVGLAPGAADDAEGKPFCGAEGELLTRIIQAIELTRADVYLTHIVKCAPPGGRPPLEDEARACLPFLFRQLAAVGPSAVCVLGEAAAQLLLGTRAPLEELRGRFYSLAGGLVAAPTHDLASLLQQQDKKRQTWDDMKMIRREINR